MDSCGYVGAVSCGHIWETFCWGGLSMNVSLILCHAVGVIMFLNKDQIPLQEILLEVHEVHIVEILRDCKRVWRSVLLRLMLPWTLIR